MCLLRGCVSLIKKEQRKIDVSFFTFTIYLSAVSSGKAAKSYVLAEKCKGKIVLQGLLQFFVLEPFVRPLIFL
jgi:hypothetical protein